MVRTKSCLLIHHKTAQQCVHPNPGKERRGHGGGIAVLGDGVRVFRHFAWLEVDPGKVALSPPAHQYPAEGMRGITRAVGRWSPHQKGNCFMSDIQHLIELLKSDNPDRRYDACEQLRVSRQPLSDHAIDALSTATNDPNPDVADAARRALALHAPQVKLDAVGEKETGHSAATDTITATRLSDIMIGFFAWVIFHNIYFLIGMQFDFFASDVRAIAFAISPFVIGLLLIIWTRKMWLGVGSGIAILSSTAIWLSLGLPIFAFLFPFPVGLGLLAQ